MCQCVLLDGVGCALRGKRGALQLPITRLAMDTSSGWFTVSRQHFSACPVIECERVTVQEAYVAVLSIEAADVQVDCLHRLIAGLCAADGGVELLCRLPWAHNLLVRLSLHAWQTNMGGARH